MVKIFLFLIFISLVLDYSCQSKFLTEYKMQNDYVLLLHSAIWGLGIYFTLCFFGLDSYLKLLMLVGGHYLIDYWKCRYVFKKWFPEMEDITSYYIDQMLHLLQLILCML